MCTVQQFCCVCLKSQNKLINLSDTDVDNVKFMDKLIYIVSDLNYTDYNSVQICDTCLLGLKTAYCFKKTCIKNSTTVKENLNKSNEKSGTTYSQILTRMLRNNVQKSSKIENCYFKRYNVKENTYSQVLTGLLTGAQNNDQKREDKDLILLQNLNKNEEKYYKNKNETILLYTIVESNEFEDNFENNVEDNFEEKLDNNMGISSESLLDSSISALEESLCEDSYKVPKSNSAEIDNQNEDNQKEDKTEKTTEKPINKKIDKLLHYCEFCNKSYTLKSSLNIHMKLHSDAGIQCQHCKIKVPSLAHLKKHINKHSCQNCSKNCQEAKKNYSSKICNRKYSVSNSLKQHTAIHESENNCKCKNCDKNLSRSVTGCIRLQNSNNFICGVCKINLNTTFDLRQHKNCHENLNKKYEKNVNTQNSYEKTDDQMYDLFI